MKGISINPKINKVKTVAMKFMTDEIVDIFINLKAILVDYYLQNNIDQLSVGDLIAHGE